MMILNFQHIDFMFDKFTLVRIIGRHQTDYKKRTDKKRHEAILKQ